MKLIFITRKVDRGDALTGFVFGWIEKLAQNLERLYVICQEKGDISGLPGNVEVYSFGKEKGYGEIMQAYSLWLLAFRLGRKSDGFFVHMHPIYAIMAWLPAKLFRKKIILWYTHKSVDLKLRLAHFLVDEVLTASKESFRLPSKKVRVVGHGIDLKKFQISNFKFQKNAQIPNSKFQILSIGRISPVKDYETLIKAAEILYNQYGWRDFEVEIYGKAGLAKHQSYLDTLVKFVHSAGLDGVVKFQGELNYEYVDEVYREADVFVNLSMTGSIDKTVLEAAAGGRLVLTSNEAFKEPLGQISPLLIFERNNPLDLAQKIIQIRKRGDEERYDLERKLRAWVEREHNLDNLTEQITSLFSGSS